MENDHQTHRKRNVQAGFVCQHLSKTVAIEPNLHEEDLYNGPRNWGGSGVVAVGGRNKRREIDGGLTFPVSGLPHTQCPA